MSLRGWNRTGIGAIGNDKGPRKWSVFSRIPRTAASLLKVPAAFVALVDLYRDLYVSHFGFGESLGVAAYHGVPLRLGTGPVIGSFCVIDTQPHAWSASKIELVEELAMTAVREIETLRRDIVAEVESGKRPACP